MWGDVMQKEIEINTPFITLGQLLKEEGIIGTGGQAKWYLREHTVHRSSWRRFLQDYDEIWEVNVFKNTWVA